MSSFYAPPLHKPSLDKFGKDFIKPENIVSNGAYKMIENVPQSHVTLVKNPNYWDAASVKIDKVVYKVTEDDNTAVKLWQAGELDLTIDIPERPDRQAQDRVRRPGTCRRPARSRSMRAST